MIMKLKKCRNCQSEFVGRTPLQIVCSIKCATEIAIKKRTSEGKKSLQLQKRELIKAKKAARPLKWHVDKAQVVFNRWIVQVRDKGRPCLTCGTVNPKIQYCASHYRTRKAASQLRFNPDNVHKCCNKRCNLMLSGNIEAYRPALIVKIGQDRHDALINNHESKRWTKEECMEIERKYKELLKNDTNSI